MQFTATTPEAVETEYSAFRASVNDSKPEPSDAHADADKATAIIAAVGLQLEKILMTILGWGIYGKPFSAVLATSQMLG